MAGGLKSHALLAALMRPDDRDRRSATARRSRLGERRLHELLVEGARLFDSGRFFESHEAWEEAWLGAPEEERDFFQGLIHAAAACLHHERGNQYGYSRQLERLRRRLGRYPGPHRGVDTSGVVSAVSDLGSSRRPARYPTLGLDTEQGATGAAASGK